MPSYADLLKDPRWQRRRLEALECAMWACENCNDTTTTLHVHHRRYIKGRKPWEYGQHELQVLCEPCHAAHHETEKLRNTLLDAGADYEDELIALIAGYLWVGCDLDDGLAKTCEQRSPDTFMCGAFGRMMGSADPKTRDQAAFAFWCNHRPFFSPPEEDTLQHFNSGEPPEHAE